MPDEPVQGPSQTQPGQRQKPPKNILKAAAEPRRDNRNDDDITPRQCVQEIEALLGAVDDRLSERIGVLARMFDDDKQARNDRLAMVLTEFQRQSEATREALAYSQKVVRFLVADSRTATALRYAGAAIDGPGAPKRARPAREWRVVASIALAVVAVVAYTWLMIG